jgi:alpha-L-fucosidase 2
MRALPIIFAVLFFRFVSSQLTLTGLYNEVWLTPTSESSAQYFVGGMPLGNGDTQALAWANASSGGVSLYISKQNALASDASNYKLALLTLSMAPNPFSAGGYFNQTLDISTGTVYLSIGGSQSSPAASFSVWVDALSNSVYVQAQSPSTPVSFSAELTPVRPNGYAAYAAPWKCTSTSSAPDVTVDPLPPSAPFPSPATLVVLHENLPSDRQVPLIVSTLTTQHLADAVSTVPDIFSGRRFGVAVDALGGGACAAFQRTSPLTLASGAPAHCAALRITTRSTQGEASRDAWVAALATQTAAAPSMPPRAQHEQWWRGFWSRTWVDIDGPAGSAGFNVSQAYAMSRYMNAAQSRVVTPGGQLDQQPIKFNGLAWTSRRPGAAGSGGGAGCPDGIGPDCRQWGPDNWWQNVRLGYWPMVADGDWAQLDVVIAYYLRAVPFLKARAQALLPDAAAFPDMLWQTETATVFGAFTEFDWTGSGRNTCDVPRPADLPPWLQNNPYIYLDAYGDGPTGELGLLILDAYLYSQDVPELTSRLPWIVGAIDYFVYKFYKDGVVRIAPTQACETLWSPWPISNTSERVEGDAPTIAVVTRLLERTLSEVPASLLPFERLPVWRSVLAAMPPLPIDGAHLAAAVFFNGKTHNSESVALYSVHPARHFSVGRLLTGGVASLAAAQATYFVDPNAGGSAEGNNGWHQAPMLAALLGLRNETAAIFLGRTVGHPLPGFRFRYFSAEDGMADEPALEFFSNLQAGVQFALLQTGENGTAVVLPGWPCEWDAHFKLRAPENTTVEGVWRAGRLVNLTVLPTSRAPFVIVAPGC